MKTGPGRRGGMMRCSLGQPGRSVCVCVCGMRVCTVRYAAAPQAKTVGITSHPTPPVPAPARLLPLVLPLLTPPIAIFTLCTCKRNCTNGIISCFLPLPRREAASHFVLFCLSFWFAFVLDSFNFSYPTPLAPCANTAAVAAAASAACLPCRRFIFISLTRALIFSLSCVRSQLQQNQSKESKGTRRQSPSTSLSASQPQNEQNFFVFLWGVSNNFWLIELLIKLIEMQREAATTLVNKNNVDWIKYFKAYCTSSERERERETKDREGCQESVSAQDKVKLTHTHTYKHTGMCCMWCVCGATFN